MTYERRVIDDELDELFAELPAIALDGLKGVGKTSTASERAASMVRLDSGIERVSVEADPRDLLSLPRPLLIDEWQRVPETWDVVRRAVDDARAPGQFLLTGSATPRLGATAHSGAGRIVRLRMRPLASFERHSPEASVSLRGLLNGAADLHGRSELTLRDYVVEITNPGLPGLRSSSRRAREAQLDGYLRNVVDRDVPEAGLAVRKPEAMLDWLRAYAAASSSTASYTAILDAATPSVSDKPTKVTSIAYRDVLTQLWLLDPVPAWGPLGNPLARLAQAPKHQLADPALAAHLLGLSEESLIKGDGTPLGPQESTLLGRLFESLATLDLRVYAQAAEARVGHLRTRNGDHELDLVVIRRDGRVLAVEVKLGGAIDDRDVRHLLWAKHHLGDQLIDAIVISTGPNAYRRKDGIGVVPLGLLGP